MRNKFLLITTLLFTLAFAALAADVTGKWTAQVPGRGGQTRETTFTFKADGSTLTGSMSGFQGNDFPISDGKIDGDNVSFKVVLEFNGNSITQNFSGTVSGDEMKLKREGGRGGPTDIVAKRAK
jgi:hypothetical protein